MSYQGTVRVGVGIDHHLPWRPNAVSQEGNGLGRLGLDELVWNRIVQAPGWSTMDVESSRMSLSVRLIQQPFRVRLSSIHSRLGPAASLLAATA